MKKSTKFYAVVYNDGSVAGPVLDSLWTKKSNANSRADVLEKELMESDRTAGGAGVIEIDTANAQDTLHAHSC
jgi:hypothetical protein